MAEGLRRQQPAARRALDEALLDQERLDDLLDRVARLGERRGDGLDADRTAAEAFGDELEIAAVERVEAERVDLEPAERLVGLVRVDRVDAVDRRRSRGRGGAAAWRCAACRASGGRSRSRRRR